MGLFGSRGLSSESVLTSTFVTFGQSIDAVESANNLTCTKAWDLFVNSVGQCVDTNLMSVQAGDIAVELGKFPKNHQITTDLIDLRSKHAQVQNFVDSNKRVLDVRYSPKAVSQKIDWKPQDFANTLVGLAKSDYPNFGDSNDDQKFYAILGIFMMTLISDSQSDTSSNLTFRRAIGYEFTLRWLAQWNISKVL
jgi:hypothetical protein